MEVRPRFNPPLKQLVYRTEGKALADALRRIHSYSGKQGLRPITDFFGSGEDDEDSLEWFIAGEGLEATRSLVSAIQTDPKATPRWNKEDPDGLETLLDDLNELIRCLEAAEEQKSAFRLELG